MPERGAAPSTGPTRARSAFAVGLPLGGVVAAASWIVLLDSGERATSWFTSSPLVGALGLAVTVALLVAGALAGRAHPDSLLAGLLVLLGVVWLAPAWWGWESGPPAARAAALLVAPLLPALLLHIALLPPPGRPWPGRRRSLVTGTYVAVATLSLARALVREPIRDPACWVGCGERDALLVVWSQPSLARVLGAAGLVLTVLLAPVAVAHLLRTVRLDGRRVAVAVAAAATATLVLEALHALSRLMEPVEQLTAQSGRALFLARGAALLLVAVAAAAEAARTVTRRRRIAALALELGEGSTTTQLETGLARILSDDTVAVRYFSPRTGGYLDGDGEPVPAEPAAGGARTRLVRDGQPVAVVLHTAHVSGAALEQGLGPAARAVLDNERLRVERLAQLAELAGSRARVVAAADAHRLRLERDLHDGAQQRLLTATYQLRLARTEAGGAPPTAAVLDEATDRANELLAGLRQFAHGVYPVVLDEAGLEEALWSLTDTSEAAVDLRCELPGRLPPGVERAVYRVVKDALTARAGDGAEPATCPVSVSVTVADGAVTVDVRGTGPVDATHLQDRAGAVGGELEATPDGLRAVIPCASSSQMTTC